MTVTANISLKRTQPNIELERFWQQGAFHYFKGENNLKVHYAHFDNQTTLLSIVISPGRGESYLKYQETVFELYQFGYSIFILDHRGQGLSDRMLRNPHKGYVRSFDDYAHDLYQFITTIVIPTSQNNNLPYLIGHSMGCAVAVRMLQLYPNVIKNAALLSPMIAINTGLLSKCIATQIVNIGNVINQWLSKESWYFLGQSNYKSKTFSNNRLTHCKKRYQSFMSLYVNNTSIQLGGVTIHWLYEALKAERNIFTSLNRMITPILVLQAENDTIVDNKKQNLFCESLHQLSPNLIDQEPTIIKSAYHELLFEKNEIRTETLSKILQFFECSTSD